MDVKVRGYWVRADLCGNVSLLNGDCRDSSVGCDATSLRMTRVKGSRM